MLFKNVCQTILMSDEDYCVKRKHLIDNNLLDANVQNVTDDPNCKLILYNGNFTTFMKLNNGENMTEMEVFNG